MDCDDSVVWFVVVQGQTLGLSLDDYRVVLSLLPFLEIGREGVLDQIQDLSDKISFPELILIEAGFKNGSEHWVGCALTWLEKCEVEEIRSFDSYLVGILGNKKKYSQSVRHKVKALLKLVG
ncbi:MAG: hypothetical protein P8X89_24310 [Reinekea sp.]